MVRRRIRVRKRRQNSLAMVLVTMIVLVMVVVVAINNNRLNKKLAIYQERQQLLQEQIDYEKNRAESIAEFEKYTGTKRYIEDLAREKLGLVYEDEILIQTQD